MNSDLYFTWVHVDVQQANLLSMEHSGRNSSSSCIKSRREKFFWEKKSPCHSYFQHLPVCFLFLYLAIFSRSGLWAFGMLNIVWDRIKLPRYSVPSLELSSRFSCVLWGELCVSGPISQLDEGKDSRKGPTVAVDLPTGQTLLQVLIVGTSTEEETTGCP